MVFSSALFLFIALPIVFLLYYLLPRKCQNVVLLIASILFYTWGEPRFILILLASITVDFFIAKIIDAPTCKHRKAGLVASLLLNLGLLAYCKYASFCGDNRQQCDQLIGLTPFRWSEVALPIGISFVTFQKISYIIDVYRGDHKAQQHWGQMALYILMFPQLIAGPIIRYKDLAGQLTCRTAHENYPSRLNGLFRFVVGLSKKVLIANVLAVQVDVIFNTAPNALAASTAWIGMLAYTFQIYFDFSGYSDMALGLGLMLGYRFPENFNFPYISQSVSEFWKRWHITLGQWMMDYLYIPLGGNRVRKGRNILNLGIVFLLSGLWHGAAWTFVVWGLYHGCFIILDKIGVTRPLQKLGKIPAALITLFVVMIGWVIFRADSMSYATNYIAQLFHATTFHDAIVFDNRFIFTLTLAIGVSCMGFIPAIEQRVNNLFSIEHTNRQYIVIAFIILLLYILNSSALLAGGLNPFIYFRF